ncbi:hypothetical protein DEO72_LG3g267 [Vigna unguiculata]|uniref:Uncharacterized protein n=1 Tax=Vigna unguiculata TaxID=3917 RepID=A0A4D6LB09_VIGUN|nr:hypothetical protein DEO72_LG3g267 [Vigna unguiculata]
MPVLETLGGALFGALLQVLFDKLDSHHVLNYFRGRNLDGKLLKKLKRKLMDINAVIDDAEQKQFSNSLVKEWLDEVRDTLYDAEDILDEIDYEFSKTVLEAESQTISSKELPSTLHELTNLRCLELLGTTLRKAPVLLGKLKNLQVWMKEFKFSIRHLVELDLHGELSIQNLEYIMNPCDTLAADLKNKTHLERLRLEWNFKRSNDDSIKVREVVENLQPPKDLKYLSIDGYSGTKFPSWLSVNSLSNMVSLTLKSCKNCLWLPSLGLLTVLKYLKIDGLDFIGRIDADFYGNSSSSFPSLETLIFTDMKYWEEWQCMPGAFRYLQNLYVKDCPKLKGHFPEQLSHLKKLFIENCKQLVASIPRAVEIEGVKMEASSFDMIGPLVSHTPLECLRIDSCPGMNIPINHCPFLLELHISYGCDSLTTFSLDLFPKLRQLVLDNCCNLRMISQEHPHSHLKFLVIAECSEFESFCNEGLFAPQLETFQISGLKKWKSMPKHMSALLPSLHRLWIIDGQGPELSEGCLPSNLKEMYLWNCSKVVGSLKGVWGTNPSLKCLSIRKVDVESFPGEGFLPLSLTELVIFDCSNLKELNYKGLCHLSSLRTLSLEDCPVLQCLPEEGLPKSISNLFISDCPLLKQRCKKQQGEDWEKIAHIENIIVDQEQVNI